MAKGKYTLGFVTTELTRNNNNNLFQLLKTSCFENGISLVVYEGREIQSQQYADQQYNFIYEFLDPSVTEYLAILNSAVPITYDEELFNTKFASKSRHPLITYYHGRPGHHALRTENIESMKKLVSHLTDDHGYQSFAVIKGPKGEVDSEERFKSAINELKSRDLYKNSRVFEGSWTANSGIKVIKQIIRQSFHCDAIIFPNDEAAIAALDYINNFVPEYKGQFAVVGFDDAMNARNISPQLTTVAIDHEAMVTSLMEIVKSNPSEIVDKEFPTELIIRSSCGSKNYQEATLPTRKLFTEHYHLHENVHSFELEEFFERLTIALNEREIAGCYISLYQVDAFHLQENQAVPENSELIFNYQNGTRREITECAVFKTKNLLPEFIDFESKASCLLVKTLFFSDEHFGFVIFDLRRGRVEDVQDLSVDIATSLNTVLLFNAMKDALQENKRLMRNLTKANEQLLNDNSQLKTISLTDEMTGLLNRRGFFDQLTRFLSQTSSQCVTLLYADMDNLKLINDKFGHHAGDNAIVVMAKILEEEFRNTDIVSRMGGDEFVICADIEDPSLIEAFINRVNKKLEFVNKTFGHPYEVSVSFGTYTMEITDGMDIHYAIDKADHDLYQQKLKKKND